MSGGLDYHDALNCGYSLTVTIPAGSSAATGVVAIINDDIYEGDENFFLDLSVAPASQGVGINEGSPLRATVTIQDNDGEIYIYIKFAYTCSRSHSTFTFTCFACHYILHFPLLSCICLIKS